VLLHLAGIALGWALRHANAWLPRVAGAAVVVLGATLLAQAV
jgi:urease accessory protein